MITLMRRNISEKWEWDHMFIVPALGRGHMCIVVTLGRLNRKIESLNLYNNYNKEVQIETKA